MTNKTKTTKIWFNHWFSTAYRIIELIKNNEDNQEFYIVGTNDKSDCVYQKVCDEFYKEPVIKDSKEYVKWCVEFCKEHSIDIFVPRRGMVDIGNNLELFTEIGTKVLVNHDKELTAVLNNKFKTAELFEREGLCKVPQIELANNLEEFKIGYEKVKQNNDRVCIKYSVGEGATSFRVIDDRVEDIRSLDNGIGSKMSYDQVVRMLGSVDSFEELMIMPYLDGREISIDSLNTKSGVIAVPRYKMGSRVTHVDINEEMINISRRFAEVTGITCPYNLQLRYHKGELYLLEVNTRMAGGTHIGCMAGVNIPYLAIKELMGQDIVIHKELKSLTVTQIETPVILSEQ